MRAHARPAEQIHADSDRDRYMTRREAIA